MNFFCPLPPPCHAPGRRIGSTLPSNSAAGQSRRARSFCASCLLLFNISWQSRSAGVVGAAQCRHLHWGVLWALGPCPPAASTVPARLGDVALGWQQAQGAHRAPAAVVVLSLGLEAGGPGRMRGSCLCFGCLGGGSAGMCTGPEAGCRAQGRALDALRASEVGCTARHPRGMRVTAPTGAAQNSSPAGCTERHPRGLHVTATTREARHGTHAGCTPQTRGRLHSTAPTRGARHGTHTAPTRHPQRSTGARCVVPGAGCPWWHRAQVLAVPGAAGTQSAASCCAPTPSSSSTRCLGGGHRHMMGSDVGAPRVSHATACCHPHGHCGQTPGTLGTAGCC